MFCLFSFPQRILLAAYSFCIFQEAIWMHNKARKCLSFSASGYSYIDIFYRWFFIKKALFDHVCVYC